MLMPVDKPDPHGQDEGKFKVAPGLWTEVIRKKFLTQERW